MKITRLQVLRNVQARTLRDMRRNDCYVQARLSRRPMRIARNVLSDKEARARVRARVLASAAAVLGLASSGCTLIESDWRSEDARKVQMVVSGAIAVDTAQTVQFSRSPECTRERNPLAFGGDAHPTPRDVVLFNIPYAVGHWFLGKWVDQKWSGKWQQKLYWSLSLGGHGAAIGNNFAEGISPVRKFECP